MTNTPVEHAVTTITRRMEQGGYIYRWNLECTCGWTAVRFDPQSAFQTTAAHLSPITVTL